jgi:hypothetical protein
MITIIALCLPACLESELGTNPAFKSKETECEKKCNLIPESGFCEAGYFTLLF